MRFRKLRIAWSVVWGIACVLLIALWVREYRQAHLIVDSFENRPAPNRSIFIHLKREPAFSCGFSGVPYWSIAVGFVALGAATWINWDGRFSLRTLLIATTLLAVMLGLIVWLNEYYRAIPPNRIEIK